MLAVLFVLFFVNAKEQRATATAYYKAPVEEGFTYASRLSLPRVATNRRWYGVWIMVQADQADDTPLFQIGLMRREQDLAAGLEANYLAAFIAYRRKGKALVYEELPRFGRDSTPQHEVLLARRGGKMYAKLDGNIVHVERTIDILNRRQPPTLTLAAELFSYGDHASGTIESVRIFGSVREANRSPNPTGFYTDRGTCLEKIPAGYRALGEFNSQAPSNYTTRLATYPSPCREY